MPDNIYIGNFPKGLTLNPLPFNIDNDAFPQLNNAYVWRGRAKRKRGTVYLGQLEIQVQSVANSTPPLTWQIGQIGTLDGSGNFSGNLISTPITAITQATQAVVTVTQSIFSLGDFVLISGVLGMTQINSTTEYKIVAVDYSAGTITLNVDSSAFSAYTSGGVASVPFLGIASESISLSDGTNTYTEPDIPDGTLIGTPGGTGTINYATGAITISGGAADGILVGLFEYYPGLPVMGLEDLALNVFQYPLLLAFDTDYAYQVNQSGTPFFYNVSYYKASNNPVYWTGQDYQQFWSANYEGAFWATNNNPGMQFEMISAISVGSPTTITTAFPHGLVTGDWVWFNEITGTDAGLLNGQAFQITVTDSTDFTVAVDTSGKSINNTGIFQTLTAVSPTSTGDGIRWYDGDMTGGTGLPISTQTGWVNFAPPLTALVVSIDDEPEALYYLVGALAIVPFKDRLLFFSPWIQTSGSVPVQLPDTVIWSWNGTPYYSLPVPVNQTFDVRAYYVDQTGFGGWLAAGLNQAIVTVNNNEDVLLVGFTGKQTRFVYTGNDISPFLFFFINSELGSSATFSGITLDRGGLTIGTYGIAMTTQQGTERIDLVIPDEIFQIQAQDNAQGVQRVNSVRDFFKEWIYFTYPITDSQWKYPTQSLLFNYRDNTWSILYENFTAQGNYRKASYYTWATIGAPFPAWETWSESWNSGTIAAQFPSVVGGNPQGYVLIKGEGTAEARSGTIQALMTSDSGNRTQIVSNNHCVSASNPITNYGDYLYIDGCLGTTAINGLIGQVISIIDENNFVIDLPFPSGTYLGLGTFARLSQPLIQTKQFNLYWDQGRQVRLQAQKYLMDRTYNGQVTINIYLSQDPDSEFNNPNTNTPPNSLIYSQLMYTCPESTNIGLTPSNSNLQMPTASSQYQIWHRLNTSLQGDSVQIGVTLNDAQMRNLDFATAEISLHAIQFSTTPGPLVS